MIIDQRKRLSILMIDGCPGVRDEYERKKGFVLPKSPAAPLPVTYIVNQLQKEFLYRFLILIKAKNALDFMLICSG